MEPDLDAPDDSRGGDRAEHARQRSQRKKAVEEVVCLLPRERGHVPRELPVRSSDEGPEPVVEADAEDEPRGEAGENQRDEEQRPLEPAIDGNEGDADEAQYGQYQPVKGALRRDGCQGGCSATVVAWFCCRAVRAQDLAQPGGQDVVAHKTDQDQSQRVPIAEVALPDPPPRCAEKIAD